MYSHSRGITRHPIPLVRKNVFASIKPSSTWICKEVEMLLNHKECWQNFVFQKGEVLIKCQLVSMFYSSCFFFLILYSLWCCQQVINSLAVELKEYMVIFWDQVFLLNLSPLYPAIHSEQLFEYICSLIGCHLLFTGFWFSFKKLM